MSLGQSELHRETLLQKYPKAKESTYCLEINSIYHFIHVPMDIHKNSTVQSIFKFNMLQMSIKLDLFILTTPLSLLINVWKAVFRVS